MAMLLKWKHSIKETPTGYRVDMLAVEHTPAYVGGLVGGKVRWLRNRPFRSWRSRTGGRLST
jgi:hypothetical protein